MPVPFLDCPRPHAFAHRGGAAHAPENSWPAFEHAVKLGYAYLETDARATSDGKLMAFHDRTLDRVTDGSGPIGSRTYREVSALRVAGSEPIPLIEDLLGAWPDARFNIDLKDEPGIALLAERAAPHRSVGPGVRDLVLRQQAADRARAARPAGVHGDLAGRDRRGPLHDRRCHQRTAAGPARPPARAVAGALCPGAGEGGLRVVRAPRPRPRP